MGSSPVWRELELGLPVTVTKSVIPAVALIAFFIPILLEIPLPQPLRPGLFRRSLPGCESSLDSLSRDQIDK